MVERHLVAYRRMWLIIVSGFFEPLFYLLSMRLGVGRLVGDVTVGGRPVTYVEFVAPALMATSAMNGAIYDSTGNVMVRLRQMHLYDGVLATPMTPADVAVGDIGWALLRGQLYAASFLVVMTAMGLVHSWSALLTLPASAAVGLVFAALGFTATSYMRGWPDMDWVTVATMPMLMFSATFFPVEAYGRWRWAVNLSPLYHGVAMIRSLAAGVWAWSMLIHVAVLVVLAVVAVVVAARRIDRLLRA